MGPDAFAAFSEVNNCNEITNPSQKFQRVICVFFRFVTAFFSSKQTLKSINMEKLPEQELIMKLCRTLYSVSAAEPGHFPVAALRQIAQLANLLDGLLLQNTVQLKSDSKAALLASKARNFIIYNFAEPLPTIRQLAREFGTNDFLLKDSFSKAYGCGIYKFYTDVRLEFAFTLVIGTSEKITSICLQSGFNDYTSFLKSFKKKFGKNPAAFRSDR